MVAVVIQDVNSDVTSWPGFRRSSARRSAVEERSGPDIDIAPSSCIARSKHIPS